MSVIIGGLAVAVLGGLAIVARQITPTLRSAHWRGQWSKPRFGFHAFGVTPSLLVVLGSAQPSLQICSLSFAAGAFITWLSMLAFVEPARARRLFGR